jgi:Carboxypeptidase regulatory-like domain
MDHHELQRESAALTRLSRRFIVMAAPKILLLVLALLLTLSTVPARLVAQTTVGTGSIVGTVSDPTGAVIIAATVTITNVETRQLTELTTNSSGLFNSGALVPGDYKILVSGRNFTSTETTVTVLLGNTATANLKLQVGNKEIVEVHGSALQVNTEQPTVQGVLDARQIENLPINGRNFQDLAQLEPGVQIQDGANFGKDGFSSISFGAVSGAPLASRWMASTFPTR